MSDWEYQLQLEAQRYAEEQELLMADPAYRDWLEYIAASAASEVNEKEMNCGDHG